MRRLTNVLNSGKPAVSAWCGITDTHYIEAVSGFDFDAAVLDMQHGFWDETTVQSGITTLITHGKAPLVRIPLERWDIAARVLDFGALAVIAPMINCAADARQLVAATRFVPVGARSFGPRHAAGLYGVDTNEYLTEFDQHSYAMAMIETREAYDNLDDIIGVDGIDAVLIGPSDLSISFRQNPVPDAYGPDTIGAIKDIIQRCQAANIKVAAFTIACEEANMLAELGVDIITVGLDQTYLAGGIKPLLAGLNFR
ncbi:MAG: 4-hydroxy-2-oxoheptanedioate aldolase [Planctomycetota bacterium]|jgi:4-hydroxy-2-oxoheptanedioate aldolase